MFDMINMYCVVTLAIYLVLLDDAYYCNCVCFVIASTMLRAGSGLLNCKTLTLA